MSSDLVLGIDVGGTAIKAAAVTRTGTMREKRVVPTPGGGPKAIAACVAGIARDIQAKAGRAFAVGVGWPTPVDPQRGVVLFDNKLGSAGVNVAALIRRATGLPACIENDANAAALAEYLYGAGRGAGSLVLLTLGTGVGGGIVLGGEVWHGRDGAAGEIGHIKVRPGGQRCLFCRRRGCLEAYAGAQAILRRYRAAGRKAEGMKDIVSAARRKERPAVRVVSEMAEMLGMAVADLANILNPEIVVIGGGVARAGNILFRPIRAAMAREALPNVSKGLRVVPAKLGNDAGLLGAAGCAWKRFGTSASSPTSTTGNRRLRTASSN
ncbi:MAG: ROK family protein [Candidatus Brocadiae bacterium]|nr:ROK family protein [Candidatus Brocadiia bacterium]